MTAYTPANGDRVRVTRYRPDGSTDSVMTGIVRALSSFGCLFINDDGYRHYLAATAPFEEGMRGWRQTIERA